MSDYNTKVCKKCKRELPATTEFFHKSKTNKYGVRTVCRECRSKHDVQNPDWYRKYYHSNKEWLNRNKAEYQRRYYEKNKEKITKKNKEHYRNNKLSYRIRGHRRKAKMKKLPANFTNEQWEACKKHFNYKCAYCSREPDVLNKEHFVPVSKGGEFTVNNIIPSCGSCNSSKHNKSFFEWYPTYKYYSKRREEKILKYLEYNDNQTQQLALL